MEKKWVRVGKCRRCGACERVDNLPVRLRIYELFSYGWVAHAGPCPHFYWDNGLATCAIYHNRPWMCREFPRDPIDLVALPGCGYSFLDNEGRDMMAVLRQITLEKARDRGFEDVVEFLNDLRKELSSGTPELY